MYNMHVETIIKWQKGRATTQYMQKFCNSVFVLLHQFFGYVLKSKYTACSSMFPLLAQRNVKVLYAIV